MDPRFVKNLQVAPRSQKARHDMPKHQDSPWRQQNSPTAPTAPTGLGFRPRFHPITCSQYEGLSLMRNTNFYLTWLACTENFTHPQTYWFVAHTRAGSRHLLSCFNRHCSRDPFWHSLPTTSKRNPKRCPPDPRNAKP